MDGEVNTDLYVIIVAWASRVASQVDLLQVLIGEAFKAIQPMATREESSTRGQ